MLPNNVIVVPNAIRTAAFGAITGSYTNLGAAFTDSVIMLRATNTTDRDIYISWFNGVDHMFVPTGQSSPVYNFAANKGTGGALMTPAHIQYQLKSATTAPGSGSVTLETFTAVKAY